MSDRRPGGWTEAGWRAGAERWIADRLSDAGVRPTGAVETHRVRFWSITLTVETDAGRFWFKENCPQQAFEARLVDALYRLSPDRMLVPTAVDLQRGWLLSADQGPVLADAGPVGVEGWERLLRDYGSLQRASAALDPAAVDLTVLDPVDAPAHLSRRIDELSALPVGDLERLDPAEAARLRAMGPRIQAYADALSALGLPLTVEHSDLHPANAFVTPTGRPLRIFDFGDAVWSHPLCSLLVPVRVMARDDEGPALTPGESERAVDAYLEVFSDLTPLEDLRAAVPAALALGHLNRHESWRRVLLAADDEARGELGGAPAAWLALLT